MTSIGILEQLEDLTLDVVLVRTPLLRSTNAEVLPLEDHRFVVALPHGHALAELDSLRLIDLAHERFVMYSALPAADLHSAAMLACKG